jgi:hypothetical protein
MAVVPSAVRQRRGLLDADVRVEEPERSFSVARLKAAGQFSNDLGAGGPVITHRVIHQLSVGGGSAGWSGRNP